MGILVTTALTVWPGGIKESSAIIPTWTVWISISSISTVAFSLLRQLDHHYHQLGSNPHQLKQRRPLHQSWRGFGVVEVVEAIFA